MANEVKIKFSKEHSSKSNPDNHVDVMRHPSDQAKGDKIGHSPMPTDKIPVSNTSGSSNNN